MKQLTLAQRVLRAYAIGILTLVAFVIAGGLIGGAIADTVPSDGFRGLGIVLMWIFGSAAAAVLAQIPLGRLVGLGWLYGIVLTAIVAVWTVIAVWALRDFQWLSGGAAVGPLIAAALTGRRGVEQRETTAA